MNKLGIVTVILVAAMMTGGLFIVPYYNVWQQEMSGKAEFAKAEQNRKIKIEEAKANLEAEKLNAQAEVEPCQRCRRSHQNREWEYYPCIYPIFMGTSAKQFK